MPQGILPGILIIVFIVVLYITTYALNKKMPAPDVGQIDEVKCGACSNYSCAIKQQTSEEK